METELGESIYLFISPKQFWFSREIELFSFQCEKEIRLKWADHDPPAHHQVEYQTKNHSKFRRKKNVFLLNNTNKLNLIESSLSSDSRSKRRRVSSASSNDEPQDRRARVQPPPKSKCLGVFGLSPNTKEDKIHEIFSKYGKIKRINVIFDTKVWHEKKIC